MDAIETRLIEVISQKTGLKVENISPDIKISEIGLPSLDFIELIFNLEEEFDIEIPESADFGTVGEFIAAIKSKVEQNASPVA